MPPGSSGAGPVQLGTGDPMRWQELAEHERDLGFVPRDCVRWLDPPELLRSAARVLVARAFADFGDKRELQGVFPDGLAELGRPPQKQRDQPGDAKAKPDELWIDFVADLGDGFDATYSVACLVAAPTLTIGPGALALPRADLLVLGGDEVYPTASTRDYENRTTGPYRAALPAPGAGEPGGGPSLVALPGNHDWYDGLTAFVRVFTRGRRIGAWQTIQSRSYFAINPVDGWWILGLDSQLSSYIDEPQLDFFRTRVSANLQPGDAVIVCAAEPAWVHTEANPDAFNQLHFFERTVVRNRVDPDSGELTPTGAQVRLWLTGDKHHYCRYEQQAPSPTQEPDPLRTPAQAITCGLGGAFLSSTHDLPDHLSLPPRESRMLDKDPPVEFGLTGSTYPALTASPQLMRRIANPLSPFWAGRRNPRFAATMAVVHLVLVLLLARVISRVFHLAGLMGALADPMPAVAFGCGVLVLAVLVVLGSWLRLDRGRRGSRAAAPRRENPTAGLARRNGPPTTATLVALQFVAAAITLVVLAVAPLPNPTDAWWLALVTAATGLVILVLGLLLATEAFALSALYGRTGHAALWSMSGQAIEDHKGFLRMRLTPTEITIHPVVIDEICHDWSLEPASPQGVRPVPAHGLPGVRLLEEPIVVTKEALR
jgi:hypothetical protein